MDGLFKWPYLGCMFSPCVLRILSTQPASAQLSGRLSRLACPSVDTHTYTTHPRTSIRVLTLMSLCVRHRKTRYPAFSWKWHWRSISLTHLAWQTEKCEAIGFVLSLLRLRDIWSHALLSQKRDATQCKCSAIKAVLIYLEAEEMKCNYNIIVKWDKYRTRRKCWSREVWSLISFPNYKMSFGWIWT